MLQSSAPYSGWEVGILMQAEGAAGVLIAAWAGPGLERNKRGYLAAAEGGACKNISGLKAPSTAIPLKDHIYIHLEPTASSGHLPARTFSRRPRPLRGQKHSPPDTLPGSLPLSTPPLPHPPSALLRSDTLNHPASTIFAP